ncbi:HNH endonuclease, partial [Salmonella enterica]|nr:HNH endonuclease [Salmonella enterica]
MSSLSRENILDTLDKFGELIYSDYKYQNSTTYDLEYDGVRYPPK